MMTFLEIIGIIFLSFVLIGIMMFAHAMANAIVDPTNGIYCPNRELNNKDMAKTDFTYCKGIHCPSRNQCKRYVDGLEAAKEADKPHSWIQNCRHAKLFIHKDGSDKMSV